jgi:outer membrane protein assembly factor BamD
MKLLNILRFISPVTLALLTAGCSLLANFGEEEKWSAKELYVKAQEAMAEHDWRYCTQYFAILEKRDPFSPLAQQAQINRAYCDWQDKELASALQTVNRFITLYPNHPKIDYVYYLKGLINFNDNLGWLGSLGKQDLSERDPETLRQSFDAFKVITDHYPDSPYATDAAQRMRYIANTLAEHEVHVASYYYRRGAYIAAVNRAQAALVEYRSTPATEKALYIMVRAYRALGETQLADDAERVLSSTFPRSRYLSKNGDKNTPSI